MIQLNTYITEKLKIASKRSKGNISFVILGDFLKWIFDVKEDYELSIDLINESSDQLYAIEQYYGCYLKKAYNFLMSYKDDEVEIETKKSKYDSTYEFLFVLPYNKDVISSANTKDILLRFYNINEIPSEIEL